MGIVDLGVKVGSLISDVNPLSKQEKKIHDKYAYYGRSLEQGSGLAFWFIAVTFIVGPVYFPQPEYLGLNLYLWSWLLFVVGFGQVAYHGFFQRQLFSFAATVLWLTLAITSYLYAGGWNVFTAVALPYSLTSFYLHSCVSTLRAFYDDTGNTK